MEELIEELREEIRILTQKLNEAEYRISSIEHNYVTSHVVSNLANKVDGKADRYVVDNLARDLRNRR